MSDNKLWESHRIVLPEARQVIVHQCCDYCFFVTIQGAREKRQGCIVGVRKYQTLSVRVPAVIHVMELMKSEGKDDLTRILEKGNPPAQVCGMWLPGQRKYRPRTEARGLYHGAGEFIRNL